MRRPLLGLLALCALGACEDDGSRQQPERSHGQALSPSQAPAPRVALLSTRPGASESSLHFARPGESGAPDAVATFTHVPDAEVRGALLPGAQRVLVVADMERRREPSFGAWLLAVEPGREPAVLAKGCYHASRPWVLPSGRVLVQRGESGAEPYAAQAKNGELRTDSLRVDEIDAESGAARTLHDFQGYITHIAGLFDDEVLLYRVRHQLADLVAVNVESGAVRVIVAKLEAHARDFSVDRASRSLVLANRDDAGWLVERVALDSGARTEVARAAGMWVTPGVWPGGGVLLNDGRGAVTTSGRGPSRPLGPGFDEVRGFSADGRWVVLLHRIPSDFSQPFVTDAEGGNVQRVPAPSGTRVDVVGVLP